jgi:prepilin-type N-terminal cleavage/methylation domain-containing protein
MTRTRERMRDRPVDSGFTLVELLISIPIFVAVITAATMTVIFLTNTYVGVNQRVAESMDRETSTVTFEKDVAGASTISATGPTTCATGTVVARFLSTDIVYTVPSPFVAPATLTRSKCVNGGAATSASITTSASAAPSLACATSCATSATTVTLTVPEAGGTWTLQARRRL